MLVLNEMNYKDWMATVDGAPAEILPANYLFRGVVVPGGRSTVVFECRSAAFRVGLWTSAVSLLLMLAIAWTRRNKHTQLMAGAEAPAGP